MSGATKNITNSTTNGVTIARGAPGRLSRERRRVTGVTLSDRDIVALALNVLGEFALRVLEHVAPWLSAGSGLGDLGLEVVVELGGPRAKREVGADVGLEGLVNLVEILGESRLGALRRVVGRELCGVGDNGQAPRCNRGVGTAQVHEGGKQRACLLVRRL